ncbi:YhdP family protein [Marinomonas sp. 15G1-11]|uniref:YhdP family protein n=1 Tax=Marinomonas phaeophyticola TaxID=3004091 RepID=A0ABT4JXB2_9GAMM|nr:YhdP family protein [Marinomonas sp. 15G1-11]MCZ2723027.1 YhdP family protein [Marinomonas sp. 15G1-11]
MANGKGKLIGLVTSAVWWLTAIAFTVLIVCLIVFKHALPFANEYKNQIESNLTQIIGYPVSIEQITASLEGIDPTFTVRGISLDTESAASAIRLDALSVRIDLIKSVLNFTPHFTYIRFIKPKIDLVESSGKWFLAGVAHNNSVKSDIGSTRLMDYLLTQRQITLLDGEIHLTSNSYGDSVFSTNTFYMQRIKNGVGIQMDLNHADLIEPLALELEIQLESNDDYLVNAHLTSPNIRLNRDRVTDLDRLNIDSVASQFELWARYQSNQSLQVTGLLSDMNVVSADQKNISGSAKFKAFYNVKQDSARIEVSDLRITEEGFSDYKSTDIAIDLNLKNNRTLDVLFNQLDLSLVSRWASTYINPDWFARQLLDEMAFTGKALNGSLHIPLDDSQSFEFVSNVKNVSAAGFNGIPAINKLNGILNLTDTDGYIEFDAKSADLGFPTLYDNSWAVSSLSGLVEWRALSDIFLINGTDLHIERNGADIDGKFRLEIRKESPDWILLDIKGKNIPVDDRLDYIPKSVLNDSTKEWVASALQGGQVDALELIVQSELAEDSVPHVRLDMELDQVNVRFAPDWPQAKNVKGKFQLDKEGIAIDVDSAQLSRLNVRDVKVSLPFEKKAESLLISGPISYDVANLLSVLRETNLSQTVLTPFEDWTASGNVLGRFSVVTPLVEGVVDPKVDLKLQFSDTKLNISSLDLDLEEISGNVNFHSDNGLTKSIINFATLGGHTEATLTSKFGKKGQLSIGVALAGDTDLNKVLAWRSMPELLLEATEGAIQYEADVSINNPREGDIFLNVKSSLVGSDIHLPEPFKKVSDETKSFFLNLYGSGENFTVSMQYDDLIRTRFRLAENELVGGELLLGIERPLANKIEAGFNVMGQLEFLDLADWLAFYGRYADTASSNVSDDKVIIPSWLNKAQLIVDSVSVNESNEFHNVKVSYDRFVSPEAFQIGADELNVRLSRNNGKYLLHAGYINWSSPKSEVTDTDKKSPIKASQVPNIDIQIDELIYNGSSYGDWMFSVANEGDRLRIEPITTKLTKGQFVGSLFWQDQDERSNVELVISIVGENADELTKKFAPTPFLTSKNYDVDINLSWLGHPLYFDKESVSGRITFESKNGQFTQIDQLPQFLKALGIFNINALARRLSLDFSDVYEPGLTYDSFKGVLSLQNGIVETASPIEIISPTAEFILSGKADLVTEILDEKLTASFPLGNTLPIAGLLIGAPQVAGLLFITDKLIGDQLAKVTSVQYEVKGSFDNPEIKSIKYQPIKR